MYRLVQALEICVVYMFEIVQSMMSSMYSVIYNLKTLSTGNICKSKVKINTGILCTFI